MEEKSLKENDGLLIGIDIQKKNSQVCYYDYIHRLCESAAESNDSMVANPPELEQLFSKECEDKEKLVKSVAEFIFKLMEQAKKAAGRIKVEKVCITTENFEKGILDIIKAAMKSLLMPEEKWQVISHEESYAYYAYSQKQELYVSGVMLLDYNVDGLHTYKMSTAKVDNTGLIIEHSKSFQEKEIIAVAEKTKTFEEVQQRIIENIRSVMPDRSMSSVYLTGPGFDVNEFPKEFAHMLCTGRKAFAGQNLFVKGACYCAYEEVNKDIFENIILACHNRVTTGVEVDILERGISKRFRIVRAGTNWYMANRNIDFILDDVRSITFIMKKCDGSKEYTEEVDISEIPYREGKMTRINMNLSFIDDSRMMVTIADRGFGEFVKSSGKVITKEINLSVDAENAKENVQ